MSALPALNSQTPSGNANPSATKPSISTTPTKVAAIKSFRLVQENGGPALEILSTRPLIPSIQAITDPDRLVIDLPNARFDTPEKRINVKADQISTVRADQFQQNPPVARIVLDLLAPRSFTWDSAGNRLVVHLGRNPNRTDASPFQPATTTSVTPTPQPVVTAVRADGPLALSGNDGGSGSSVTAGTDTTILRLSSGGELHVCPGTTVSVTPSQNRHNLMLSMNAGAMEAHFSLDASSDSVMTPDFRILLVGPGEFHYAFSADTQGNTCVRALPGNTASAIVNELLGDRTYQVKATDQLVFRAGQLDRVDMAVPLECGCPPQHEPQLRASNTLPVQNESDKTPHADAALSTPPAATNVPHAAIAPTPAPAKPAPLDASVSTKELHIQIAAPFVFHASGPPPVEDLRKLPLDSRPPSDMALAAPLPPPSNQKSVSPHPLPKSDSAEPPHGFFKRVGRFFKSIFH